MSRNPFLYAVYRLSADAEGEYRHVEPQGRPGDGTTWPRKRDGGEGVDG